jgi:hypothetical protein
MTVGTKSWAKVPLRPPANLHRYAVNGVIADALADVGLVDDSSQGGGLLWRYPHELWRPAPAPGHRTARLSTRGWCSMSPPQRSMSRCRCWFCCSLQRERNSYLFITHDADVIPPWPMR